MNGPAYSFPDQLSRLPAAAQRRYKAFAARLEDVTSLLDNHMERERAAEERVFDVERRLEDARDAEERKRITMSASRRMLITVSCCGSATRSTRSTAPSTPSWRGCATTKSR